MSISEWKESSMLMLSRRVDESIRIGNDVKLTNFSINGNQIASGLVACEEKTISVVTFTTATGD